LSSLQSESDPPAPQLVHELIERAAARWPEKEALVLSEALAPVAGSNATTAVNPRWTYRQLNERSNRLARWLLTRGLQLGDRVALLAANSDFYVVAYFAILKAGGVAVPLSTGIDVTTLLHQVAICKPRLLLVGPRSERVVVEAGAKLAPRPPEDAAAEGAPGDAGDVAVRPEPPEPPERSLTAIVLAAKLAAPALRKTALAVPVITLDEVAAELAAQEVSNLALPLHRNGLASIIFTSGSTGKPRGAGLTHRGLCVNVDGIVRSLTLQHDDRVLVVLPLSYVFGKSLLTMCFAVGATVVLENRFQYPRSAVDTAVDERCTGLAGVPSTFAILAHRTDLRSRELPDLKWMAQAGGGMSPALIRELIEMVPWARLYIMYGATEGSGRLTCLPAEELAGAIGSIGRPIAGVELKIYRDRDGEPAAETSITDETAARGSECAIGEVGELFAQGDNIMLGYFGDLVATGEVLSERGYATGDLAYRDERGLFWLVGRKRDMLKVGGHRVGAREIEDAILDYPTVSEVAVIGVPDEVMGDRLVAYVVPRDPTSPPDLRTLQTFLRDRLASHKIPTIIEVVTALPKNAAGKVMKRDLLQRWTAGHR
jgi:long-chain acyl-CoA synthetase